MNIVRQEAVLEWRKAQPARMSPDEFADAVRDLAGTLGLAHNEFRIVWELRRVIVVLPPQIGYLPFSALIADALDAVAAGIEWPDPVTFTDEQFSAGIRGVRGG